MLLGALLEAWWPGLGVWNVVGRGLVRAFLTLTLAQYKSRSWSPGAWTWGAVEVVLGGLLEAWRSGLGVWNVVGGGLGRACLTLPLAQNKSRPWSPGAWT